MTVLFREDLVENHWAQLGLGEVVHLMVDFIFKQKTAYEIWA